MTRPISLVPIGAALLALALLALPGPATAQTGPEIMQKQRQLQRAGDEEERQAVRLFSKSGETKDRKFVRWTLSGADGLDKILVRFVAPRSVENTGLLIWEAKDGNDDQWLYLPAVRKPKRIVAGAKRSRFMGTDFSFEDLRPESLAANTYVLTGSERVDDQNCFVVEARPATERHAAESGYRRRRIWVRKDTYAIVKREYYDREDRLEKVETLRKLVNVTGTIWRANETEMRDVQEGTRTLLSVEERAVNRGLRPDFFTVTELVR